MRKESNKTESSALQFASTTLCAEGDVKIFDTDT